MTQNARIKNAIAQAKIERDQLLGEKKAAELDRDLIAFRVEEIRG